MTNKKFHISIQGWGLLLITLVYLLFGIYWISLDKGGAYLSDSAHLYNAASHLQNLRDLDIPAFLLTREIYPNGVHQLIAIVSAAIPHMTYSAAILGFLFTALMMAGAYQAGSLLWNKNTGLLAGALVPAFSGIARYSFISNIDIPCGALTVWAVYFLIKSEFFTHKKYSLLFFAVSSLGMLTKWAFAFFLIAPFVSVLIMSLNKHMKDLYNEKSLETKNRNNPSIENVSLKPSIISSRNKIDRILEITILLLPIFFFGLSLLALFFQDKDSLGFPPQESFWKVWTILIILAAGFMAAALYLKKLTPWIANTAAGCFLFIILTSHYYLYHFYFMYNTYMGRFWRGIEYQQHASTRNLSSFLWDFFAKSFTGLPVLALIITGLLFYLINKEKSWGKNILLLSASSGIIIIALQPVYDPRYFIPLSGILSPFAAFWVFELKYLWGRRVLTAALLIFSLISINSPFIFYSTAQDEGETSFKSRIIKQFGFNTLLPNRKDVKIKETIEEVCRDYYHLQREGEGLIVFLDDTAVETFKPLTLMYHIVLQMDPEDKLYFFPDEINLRKPHPGTPLFYYIKPFIEDSLKDVSRDDLKWDDLNPQVFYFVHYRWNSYKEETNNYSQIEFLLSNLLKPQWMINLSSYNLLTSKILPDDRHVYVFRWMNMKQENP